MAVSQRAFLLDALIGPDTTPKITTATEQDPAACQPWQEADKITRNACNSCRIPNETLQLWICELLSLSLQQQRARLHASRPYLCNKRAHADSV